MADVTERLYRLVVDGTQAVSQLDKIARNTEQIDRKFANMGKAIGGAFAAFATGTAIRGIVEAGEKLATLEASFSTLRGSAQAGADMMARVFSIVNNTGASMADVADSVQRLSIGMKDMGASNAQIEAVAENFIKLGRVGGTSMADVTGALTQFGQALSSGVLQGDEFKSLSERMPLLMQRIAASVGVPQGQLKELASQGKITADILANSLIGVGDELNDQFAALPDTFEQGMNRVQAALTRTSKLMYDQTDLGKTLQLTFRFVAAEIDNANKGTSAWTGVLDTLGATFKIITGVVAGFVNGIQIATGGVAALGRTLGAIAAGQYSEVGEIWKEYAAGVTDASTRTRTLYSALMGNAEAAKAIGTQAVKASGSVEKLAAAGARVKIGTDKGAVKDLERFGQTIGNLYLQLLKTQGPLSELQEFQLRYQLGLEKLTPAQAEQVAAFKALADAAKAYNTELANAAADTDRFFEADEKQRLAVEERIRQQRELIATLDPVGAAAAEYAEKLRQIDKLFFDGAVNGTQYDRMLKALQGSTEGAANKLPDLAKGLQDLAVRGVGDLAGAFLDADKGFKEFAANFLKQMAKMILQAQLLKAVQGSSFAGLFGFARGGAFGGATGLPHGVYNSPTFFRMPGNGPLQKFAKGGVLGEAGPEAILPLRRNSSGKLGVEATPAQVNVNVVNNAGAQVSVQQNGNDIAVIIDRVKASIVGDVRRGGNAMASALQGTYGLSRGGGWA